MVKFKPGIPDGFSLDVEPVRDLGDYLDEPSPRPQRRPKPEVAEAGEERGLAEPTSTSPVARVVVAEPPTALAVPTEVVAAPIPARPEPTIERPEERVTPQAPHPQPPPAPESREPAANEDRSPKSKAPRREISMTPETLRMSDELLEAIRSGSGQRDTKANELFHALVLLVHEAMDELDPHAIPKRGRWGTPTARADTLELKNAFLHALLRKDGSASKESSGQNYPVDSAA